MDEEVVVQDGMWAGSEMSLELYKTRLKHIAAREVAVEARTPAGGAQIAAAGVVTNAAGLREELPYLLSVDGESATIGIYGPTTNASSYWDRYDNAATYPAIREALIKAATMPDVKFIVLDINSGGGSVSGIADVGTLISSIDQNVKPVYAFTDGNMYSAAYWIGSSAREVYSSKVAGVGSIGVIATHMEVSKALAAQGVTVNVVRAGKHKALVNRYEPMTDAAREQLQTNLDAAYGVFVQHVADARGVPYTTADKQMAQGQEFFGEAALAAGLVDGIETFDSMMSKLKAKVVDSKQSFSQNAKNLNQGNNAMKKALSEQQIAAIAAGASIADVTVAAAAPGTEPIIEPSATEAAAAVAAAAEAEAAASASASTEAAAAAATPAVVVAADASVLNFLQAQVKEKDAALLAANVELSGLKARALDMEAATSGLTAIAAASVNNMRIAMGNSAVDLSAMSATALLAEHQSYASQFASKFKSGGLAAVAAVEQTKASSASPVSALERARLESTRIVKSK